MTPESSEHYIEFAHVYKTFDRPVLVDVSFYVDPGETLAIIGRSGVGKSVSLGHIMGFLKPDQGEFVVAGKNITHMPEDQLRELHKKVTMVFQSGSAVRFADGRRERGVFAGDVARLRRGQQGGDRARVTRRWSTCLRTTSTRTRRICRWDISERWRSRGRWRRSRSASCMTSRRRWSIRS